MQLPAKTKFSVWPWMVFAWNSYFEIRLQPVLLCAGTPPSWGLFLEGCAEWMGNLHDVEDHWDFRDLDLEVTDSSWPLVSSSRGIYAIQLRFLISSTLLISLKACQTCKPDVLLISLWFILRCIDDFDGGFQKILHGWQVVWCQSMVCLQCGFDGNSIL